MLHPLCLTALCEDAVWRIGVKRIEAAIEPKPGRAVRAENGGLLFADFKIDMRVVVGRCRADAFECLHSDTDLWHAVVVRELRTALTRHVVLFERTARGFRNRLNREIGTPAQSDGSSGPLPESSAGEA